MANMVELERTPKKHAINFADKIDQNILIEIFNYFKNRYVLNGDATPHFITFEFNKYAFNVVD